MSKNGPLNPLSDEEIYHRRRDAELIAAARANGTQPPADSGSPAKAPSRKGPHIHHSDADQSIAPVWVLGIGLVVLAIALAAVGFSVG